MVRYTPKLLTILIKVLMERTWFRFLVFVIAAVLLVFGPPIPIAWLMGWNPFLCLWAYWGLWCILGLCRLFGFVIPDIAQEYRTIKTRMKELKTMYEEEAGSMARNELKK